MKIQSFAIVAATTMLALLALPSSALAYVGPGAGISLIGAFWALLVALATALFFLFAWPVKRMLRHRARPARGPRPNAGDAGLDDRPQR